MTPRTVIGIDVGGTFTDVFSLDDATGAFEVAKVPSTRGRSACATRASAAHIPFVPFPTLLDLSHNRSPLAVGSLPTFEDRLTTPRSSLSRPLTKL